MATEKTADLLIELGCEELPPLSIDALREGLFTGIADGLEKAGLPFDRKSSRSFSTPRRLAVLLASVAGKQPDQVIDRRGPAVAAAFDDNGKPTKAAEGFARSVGMEVDQLERLETEKGEWLYCKQHVAGKALGDLLFDIIDSALRQLPIPRPMRWSDHAFSFVRPVHWVVVLHGHAVLEGEVLGKKSGRHTLGHRIHAPGPHELGNPADYEPTLLEAHVIAHPESRKARIVVELRNANGNGIVLIDPALLDEVNNLVEWPVAVACRFDEEFLEVPHEALIASMQDHQKFFPVQDPAQDKGSDGESVISSRFIAISNIESSDVAQVRAGYERVIRPRLADARFFLEQDKEKPLSDYAPLLDDVIFHEKIGTIGDKTRRVADISKTLCAELGFDERDSVRAAELCKCDLMTQMVGEFPELQGVMGAHYARSSGETEAVATAIGEHYAPKFAGDDIPRSPAGLVVGLADRADTLVACFAAGLAPSGNKDPFALRRAALGLVRILNEGAWKEPDSVAASAPVVELAKLFGWAADSFSGTLKATPEVLEEVMDFAVQRARSYFGEQGYGTELFNAGLASDWKHIPDLRARLIALSHFMKSDSAERLAAANKRIGNILRKADDTLAPKVDEHLLELGAERQLFDAIEDTSKKIAPFKPINAYNEILKALAELDKPVNVFFDDVMVMDEDPAKRRNRLTLLRHLKSMFDEVADLSVLG